MSRYLLACAAILVVLFAAAPAFSQAAKPSTSLTGDFGYVNASGNTHLTTLSADEKVIHTDGRWSFSQLTAYVYGKTNEDVSARQLRATERADFALPNRFSVFAEVAYEHNRFAGFTSRVDEALGLGWKGGNAAKDSLSLDGGGVLTQEADVDGTNLHNPSARVAAGYKHLFNKTAYFQTSAEYVPNLKTNGAYRMNSESSLVAPLSTHVGIKMDYSVRYDSRPPTNFGSTDRVLTMGVQLTF